MGSILSIRGKRLDVDQFDIGWKRSPSAIYRKGDLILKTKPEKGRSSASTLIFDVSNKGYDDFKGQIKSSVAFLKRNKLYLKRLSKYKTIDAVHLGIAFNSRIDGKDVAVQIDHLPIELLRLCSELNIAIVLTQWPAETN